MWKQGLACNFLLIPYCGAKSWCCGVLRYVLAFSLGAGPVPALLLPEIFGARIRAKAVSVSLGVHWVSSANSLPSWLRIEGCRICILNLCLFGSAFWAQCSVCNYCTLFSYWEVMHMFNTFALLFWYRLRAFYVKWCYYILENVFAGLGKLL